MNIKEDLNVQMVNDAALILASVGFLERQIHKNLALWDKALEEFNQEDADVIEKRIHHLLAKINSENQIMDEFMLKYRMKINETQAILSGVK